MKVLGSKIIRLANKIIPKDDKSIYCRSSFLYPDNIDAVIDALISETDTKYTIYCEEPRFHYKNRANVIRVKNRWLSLFYYLRSKYVFWDIAMFGNPKPISTQITINLWHGVSFKKIGFYLTSLESSYPTSTYVVTYSDLFAEKMANAFGVKRDHVLITGEPRNDYLYNPATKEELSLLGIKKDEHSRMIFWMPTYRQCKHEDKNDGAKYDLGFPFLNEKNLIELNKACENNNVILVLKWHALQRLPQILDENLLNNIIFLTSEKLSENNIGLYSVLACSDALITDYSSVFINYMLLNRPICFAYDDIEYYRNNRGFMFEDIEQYMPGMKVQTFDGIIDFIIAISKGIDEYADLRKSMAGILNDYYDNGNAKRLLKTLGLI